MATTWSPTDHSEFVTVTSTAATRNSVSGSAYQSARSNLAVPTGVSYVTFTVTNVGSGEGTGPGCRLGLGNGVASLTNYMGADDNGVSYLSSGNVLKNAAAVATLSSYTTNDVIGMLVDRNANTVKFNKNAGTMSAAIDIGSLGDEFFYSSSLGNGSTPPNVSIASAAPPPTPSIDVVCHGDSMSLTGGVKQIYLTRLVNMLRAGNQPVGVSTRCGINGASFAYAWPNAGYASDMTADALLRVDTVKTATSRLIVFAGTNGIILGAHSAATEYTNFKTYMTARVNAGWTMATQVIVCTMLPRTSLSEVTRSSFNTSVVGDDGAFGYRVCRLDQNANIGAAGQNLNTTWFLDGLHPTDAGQQVIAQLLYAMLP